MLVEGSPIRVKIVGHMFPTRFYFILLEKGNYLRWSSALSIDKAVLGISIKHQYKVMMHHDEPTERPVKKE